MNRIKLTAIAFMLAGAVGCRTVSVRPLSQLPSYDDISFRGFAEEVLYGYGTPRTHRFDDYTKGSYHVHAPGMAEGLFPIARLYELRLEAVVVVGPYGALWAYDVISIIAEEGCTRVNWLLMPHARITVKRSGCVSPQSVSAFLAEMRHLAPSRTRDADEKSCLVIAEAGELRSSGFGCYVTDRSPDLDRMEEALNRLSKDLAVTYSAYPPIEK